MENKTWITESIKQFVNESPDNTLKEYDENAWDEPIVGFSNGDDELYKFFKSDIGDFYWEPIEIFRLTFPDIEVKEEELTVISWVLPQTKATKSQQLKENSFPSKRWVLSRLYGEEFNRKIARFVCKQLNTSGYLAVAPSLSPCWENHKSIKYGFASSWSERHAAYASGLGTFGLCDGLITEVGKAIRCGSVIAKITVEPTIRNYKTYNEYCLYFSDGSCMACAKRCPANAITANGHNKLICRQYQHDFVSEYTKNKYNINSSSCGLCQVGMPCESKIPKRK